MYADSVKRKIPVVKPSFIARCLEENCLIESAEFLLGNSKPFEGFVIACTGLSAKEREALNRLTTEIGGVYSGEVKEGYTTHLVVQKCNYESEKYKRAVEWNLRLVTFEWIQKCHASSQYLNEADFQPKEDNHSEMVEHTKMMTLEGVIQIDDNNNSHHLMAIQKPLDHQQQQQVGLETTTSEENYCPNLLTMALQHRPNRCLRDFVFFIVTSQTHTSKEAKWRHFKNVALLCDAFVLNDFDPSLVTHLLVTCELDNAESEKVKQITQTYPQIFVLKKEFLLDCLATGKFPLGAHYAWRPNIKRSGSVLSTSSGHESLGKLPTPPPLLSMAINLKGKLLCVSHYMGKERDGVKDLCAKLGAKCVDTLSRRNPAVDVLVCKDKRGEKYDAAIKWGIPIVTMEWLIEYSENEKRNHHTA